MGSVADTCDLCDEPAVDVLVGEAGDIWFCENHRPRRADLRHTRYRWNDDRRRDGNEAD